MLYILGPNVAPKLSTFFTIGFHNILANFPPNLFKQEFLVALTKPGLYKLIISFIILLRWPHEGLYSSHSSFFQDLLLLYCLTVWFCSTLVIVLHIFLILQYWTTIIIVIIINTIIIFQGSLYLFIIVDLLLSLLSSLKLLFSSGMIVFIYCFFWK